MTTEIEQKYRDALEIIFGELSRQDSEEHDLESLLQPLRIYVNDIARFQTPQIFAAKFQQFLEARDRMIVLRGELEERGLLEEARKYQTQINRLLDQVLELLGRSLKGSDKMVDDMDIIIDKIREAKSINSIRALGEALLEAGQQVRNEQKTIREGLAQLTVELTNCRTQIENLENQLEDTRIEAERDSLTSLLNRRAFDRDLEQAIERAHRFDNPLCLLLLDLDNFKTINDEYGHRVGDDVLINFARLMETSLRDFDLTYRIGGDEFAVLFTGCSLKRALSVGERVRKFLADHRYKVDGHDFRLTISGGLVELAMGEESEMLYKRADRQLYRSKSEGRNKVMAEEA